MTLVSYAEAFFGGGVIGILHQGGLPSDQSVLPVVDGFGKSVGEAEVESAGHLAMNGKRHSVINARCRALKYVDSAQLWNRASERINARRIRASERRSHLPGSKRLHIVEGAKEVGAGAVINRILHVHRPRQIFVKRPNKVKPVPIHVRNADR